MGPHPGLPGLGPAGLLGFGAGMASGVPGAPGGAHGGVVSSSHSLLKPADLHPRESDLKRPGSVSNDERLVRFRSIDCDRVV